MTIVSISIIVPIYNEEESLANAINRNISVLQLGNCDFEIILVNDGSVDSSLSIIQSHFSGVSFIKILSYAENGGFGKAIRAGIAEATKEYILCVPVDSPLNDKVFNSFKANLGKADVIASYRNKRIGYSIRMKLNSNGYHVLISWLFKMKLIDYNWIHCYRKKIFDDKKFELGANGIFILAEVLILCKKHGYTIAEIPVDQEIRLTGTATASKFSAIIDTLKEMIAFRFKHIFHSKLNHTDRKSQNFMNDQYHKPLY